MQIRPPGFFDAHVSGKADVIQTVRTLPELWAALYLTDPVYGGCRFGIIARLLAFGEINISPAYAGHTVSGRLTGGE